MITVSLVAWVSFWNHKSVFYSASVVTAISVMALMYWFGNTKRKWGDFLMMSDARIVSRTISDHGDSDCRNSFPGNIEGTSGKCDNSDGDVSNLEPASEFVKDIVACDFKSS